MLIFSLWQPKWTKGYLDGKKAGQSDSIFKTYHLILEPALSRQKVVITRFVANES